MQGWPLLAATLCNMAAPQMMSGMDACCCSDEAGCPASPSFSKCAPGKKLAGVLSTDPYVLVAKEKKSPRALETLSQSIVIPPKASVFATLAWPASYAEMSPIPHTASPPFYIVEHEFRI